MPVQAGLGDGSPGVVVRTQSELEVSQVVGRDVHTDLHCLARPPPPHDNSRGEPPASLPLPGPGLVPGVATHPAPTPVLVLVPVVTSAVGLAEVGRVIK